MTHVYAKIPVSDAAILIESAEDQGGVGFTVAGRKLKVKTRLQTTYLTTNPNKIKDDNLERLPEFDKIGKLAVIKYKSERLRRYCFLSYLQFFAVRDFGQLQQRRSQA